METHINTYKLNQKNKEYILRICMVGDSIRINCVNITNGTNSEFRRDFTLEELKNLDKIFDIIKTPYEALDYMDRALKIQKVGISEENENMKINFYITTHGIVHQLEIPLGESDSSSGYKVFQEENEVQNDQGIYSTSSQAGFQMNQNINLEQGSGYIQTGNFSESAPIIGPVIEDENQYNFQMNTINNAKTQEFNQINQTNKTEINLPSNSAEGYANFTGDATYQEVQYTGDTKSTGNILENKQNIPLFTNNGTIQGSVDAQYSGIINDNAPKFTTGISELNSQFTLGGVIDSTEQFKSNEITDIQNQFTTNTQYNFSTQNLTSEDTNNNQYDFTSQNLNQKEKNINQYDYTAQNLTSENANNNTNQYDFTSKILNQKEKNISQYDYTAQNLTSENANNNQYNYSAPNLTSEYTKTNLNSKNQYINPTTNVMDQLTTGLEKLNTQNIPQFTNSNTNFAPETVNKNDVFTTQINEYKSTTPLNINLNNNQNQYLESFKTTTQQVQTSNQYIQPSQYFQKPYITPVDDSDILKNTQNNNYYQNIATTTTTTTTTNKEEEEPRTTTFTIPLSLEKNKPTTTDNHTQYDLQIQPEPRPQISDEKINKIGGNINTLQGEHQLIQDKLNQLEGQINSYKTQLSIMTKANEQNEINKLRAENEAIKQQLLELNNLRNDAAEARFLRNQIHELGPLRKKVSEMDILRRQLEELNTLKAKAAELDSIKSQLNELNNLREQLSRMERIKQQLGELDSLRAKVAELSGVKNQLGEINQLKTQASQINILKQQINDLTNLKMNEADLEELRKRMNELERIKIEYEFEIKNLKEEQMKSSIEKQTKLMELRKSVERTKNTGMESKQLFFEDKTEQICVKGEIIHNTDELELLTRKINKLNKRLTLTLLYKATVDSDTAEAFHEKCDDAKSTLVLIETDKGKRFGGYTTCSWSGECVEKKDEDAFVFSLDKMEIYENIQGEDAIGCYPKFGPIFLGCQIRIYDNAFTKGGTTFEKRLNYNTQEDYELTDGDRVFQIKEIEVYEVIPQ